MKAGFLADPSGKSVTKTIVSFPKLMLTKKFLLAVAEEASINYIRGV